MNILNTTILTITLLFSGCTTLTLSMDVDSGLRDNSIVYSVSYPDSFTDKVTGNRVNLSFGPYRVSEADLSWTGSNTEAENPSSFFGFKETKKSGNTTTTLEVSGGPTELFGFKRTPDENEPLIKNSSRTITYKFSVKKQNIWSAHCTYNSKERITKNNEISTTEMLSSDYICSYKDISDKPNNDIWMLYIDTQGSISMSQKDKPATLYGYQTAGTYFDSDGKKVSHTAKFAGYTFKQSSDGKVIAAISAKEDTPKVWLNKTNSDELNHILAMANTALLIYSWEINP